MKKLGVVMLALVFASTCLSGCQGKDDSTKKAKVAETEKAGESETEKATAAEASESGTTAEDVTEAGIETVTESGSDLESMAAAGPFGVFETLTLDGETVTQEIFKEADLTMVNIWGTFCSPCINEMPDLGELAREYEEKGFQMVGMISDVAETEDETATLIVEETKADYRHLILSQSLYNSLSQIQVVPTTVFIDSTGKQVGYTYTGSKSKEDWSAIIDEMFLEVSK